MELEEVHSDLLALRQLYGLLQNDGDGIPTNSSENLGEKARLLLKNLLDNASEMVLETPSKIIAAQSGVSTAPRPSLTKPCTAVPKLKPPVSPDVLEVFPSRSNKSSAESKGQTSTLQKDEPPTLEDSVSELSKPRASSNTPYGKQRCPACELNSMEQQNSAKDAKKSRKKLTIPTKDEQAKGTPEVEVKHVESGLRGDENQIGPPNRDEELQRSSPSMVGWSSHLATGDIEAGVGYDVASQSEKKPDEAIDVLEDLANAVKRIESLISALQLRSQIVDSTKTPAALGGIANTEAPLMQTEEGLGTWSQLNDVGELGGQASGLGRKRDKSLSPAQQLLLLRQHHKPVNLLSHLAATLGGDNKSTATRRDRPLRLGEQISRATESPSQTPSRIERVPSQSGEYVQGFRVPTTISHVELAKTPPRAMNPTLSKADRPRPFMPPQSVGSLASVRVGCHKPGRAQIREKHRPHQMVIKPTLMDHGSSSEITVFGDKRVGTQKQARRGPQSKFVPRQPDESDSSYFSSSSWRSSSIPSETRAHHPMDPNSASETRGSSLEEDSGAEESGLEKSSSSIPYSIQGYYRDAGPSYRVGVSRRYRSDHRRRTPERTIGRLKRFKNKIGLIFHHHHHHHHHHDHSRWKTLHTLFHRKNVHEVHDRAVQKVKKSTVGNGPRKDQLGHFQALAEGLLRHVRHSKKSKASRGGIGRLGGATHVGSKKVAKKLHWWQMFRRHGGVKLPKSRNVRVGFRKKRAKRPLLKMS